MPLTITGISPEDGEPGTEVTIRGTDFLEGAKVFFTPGIEGVDVRRGSDTILYAKAPVGVRDGQITVQNPGGARATSTQWFSVRDESWPTITRVEPKQSYQGARFKISGTNFIGDGLLSVRMAGTANREAKIADKSATHITAIVPDLKAGNYRVIVKVGDRSAEFKGLFKIEE